MTKKQATLAVEDMGQLYGPLVRRPCNLQPSVLEDTRNIPQATLQQLFGAYVARYREKLTLQELEICAKLVASYDAFREEESVKCLLGMIHGDYRLDNMLFGRNGAERAITIVDWQTLRMGAYAGDLAYLMGCAVKVEDRRQRYDGLLSAYLRALGAGTEVTLERLKQDMKYQAFFGITMGIGSAVLVGQTERGDEMFITMMKRHCQLAVDLGSPDILPEAAKM